MVRQLNIPFILSMLHIVFALSVAAESSAPRPLATLPLISVNNRPVVYVPAAHYELHLLLDTGATKTVLFQSEDMPFDDLEKVGEAEVIFPALDEKVQGTRLAPFNIKLENHIYRPDMPLLINQRPPIGDRLDFAFDGVLGQDFFNSFVVEIDPDTSQVRLYEPGTNLGEHFATEIKLHIRDGAPYIDYKAMMPWEQYAKKKVMLLDTGYPGVMVFWKEWHMIKAVGKKRAAEMRETNTGIFTSVSFRIAGLRFYQAPIFLAPRSPVQAHERDGIIGSDMLRSHHHVIDFPGERLHMKNRALKFRRLDGTFYVPNKEDYIYKHFTQFETSPKAAIKPIFKTVMGKREL